VSELSDWEIKEQEMLELPSGFTAILKISLNTRENKISVSVGSGKFFFPVQVCDLETIGKALIDAQQKCKDLEEGLLEDTQTHL